MNLRFRIILLSMSALVLSSTPALSELIELPSVGSYKDIDVKSDKTFIRRLLSKSTPKRDKAIELFLEDVSSYSPPVIYAASNALFMAGRKDEAGFWFYAGQVRARFDANRCADKSASQAVSALNQSFGLPINKYMFEDIDKLGKTVERAVSWDRSTPHNYDHRWINLHGTNAVMAYMDGEAGEVTFSIPSEQWGSVAEKTREDYLRGFKRAMARYAKATNNDQ